jgi:uncharacterized protein (DUF488 family)
MKFFTIGYGGRAPDDFLDLLKRHGVATLVDVRLRPDQARMGIYAKATTSEKGLEARLKAGGIAYLSLIELGNLFLECDDWPSRYTRFLEQSGELVLDRLLSIDHHPLCLMCAERSVDQCHRWQIAQSLVVHHGWTVEHIL